MWIIALEDLILLEFVLQESLHVKTGVLRAPHNTMY